MLRALIALGPAYIKFGQLLSTRPDVVGEGLATDLRILQDALPAFNQKDSIEAIEKDLNINPIGIEAKAGDIIIFSGNNPFGLYLITKSRPSPIIKYLKYGTLFRRCSLM